MPQDDPRRRKPMIARADQALGWKPVVSLDKGLEATIAWLGRHGIRYEKLHNVRHGEKHLIDVPFAAAIDDDREQAYLFHDRGVPAFLIGHPWNYVSPMSPLRRVETWRDLVPQVIDLH